MKTVRQSICILILIMVFCLGHAYAGTSDDSDAKIKALKAEIVKLIKTGRDMEKYRKSSSKKECEEKAAQYVAAADKLREDAMDLPLNVDLRMALYQLPICVSCEGVAIESCDSLESDLKEMEQ